MDIGIFARTFPRPTLEENMDVLEETGIQYIHFNMSCAGLESLPAEIGEKTTREIRTAFELRDLKMVAVSGTFNVIHPNLEIREEMIRRCRVLIEEAPSLGTHVVTLCTGTRDPDNMWRAHPDNGKPESWNDLLATLRKLVPIAEESGVVLGIEPEIANVVDTASKARRLLDEFSSDSLKIVLDAANLIHPGEIHKMDAAIEEAVSLLGKDIVMAHAKDIPTEPGKSQAAGKGLLDWETYLSALRNIGFEGPLVLHNLSEEEVHDSAEFVRRTWANCLKGAD